MKIVGTLLYWNERYYGLGIFRLSNTNKVSLFGKGISMIEG